MWRSFGLGPLAILMLSLPSGWAAPGQRAVCVGVGFEAVGVGRCDLTAPPVSVSADHELGPPAGVLSLQVAMPAQAGGPGRF